MNAEELVRRLVEAGAEHVRDCSDPALLVDGRSCARVRCLECGTTLDVAC